MPAAGAFHAQPPTQEHDTIQGIARAYQPHIGNKDYMSNLLHSPSVAQSFAMAPPKYDQPMSPMYGPSSSDFHEAQNHIAPSGHHQLSTSESVPLHLSPVGDSDGGSRSNEGSDAPHFANTAPFGHPRSSIDQAEIKYDTPTMPDVVDKEEACNEVKKASAESEAEVIQEAEVMQDSEALREAAQAETEEMRGGWAFCKKPGNATAKDKADADDADDADVSGEHDKAREAEVEAALHLIRHGEAKKERDHRLARAEALDSDPMKIIASRLKPEQYMSLNAEDKRKLAVLAGGHESGVEMARVVALEIVKRKAMDDFAKIPDHKDQADQVWTPVTHDDTDSEYPPLQPKHAFVNRLFLTQEDVKAEQKAEQKRIKLFNDAVEFAEKEELSSKPPAQFWEYLSEQERAMAMEENVDPTRPLRQLVEWKKGVVRSEWTQEVSADWADATADTKAFYAAYDALSAKQKETLMPTPSDVPESASEAQAASDAFPAEKKKILQQTLPDASRSAEIQARRDVLDAILTGAQKGALPHMSDALSEALQSLNLKMSPEELVERMVQEAEFDESLRKEEDERRVEVEKREKKEADRKAKKERKRKAKEEAARVQDSKKDAAAKIATSALPEMVTTEHSLPQSLSANQTHHDEDEKGKLQPHGSAQNLSHRGTQPGRASSRTIAAYSVKGHPKTRSNSKEAVMRMVRGADLCRKS